MNKLKKFTYNYIMPIIPFSKFNNKVCEEWEKEKLSCEIKNLINAIITTATIISPIIYATISKEFEEWNPNYWAKARQEITSKKEEVYKIQVNKLFHLADTNKDNRLDTIEFNNLYKELRNNYKLKEIK